MLFIKTLWQFPRSFCGVAACIVLSGNLLSLGCAAGAIAGTPGLQGYFKQMYCVKISGLAAELCASTFSDVNVLTPRMFGYQRVLEEAG